MSIPVLRSVKSALPTTMFKQKSQEANEGILHKLCILFPDCDPEYLRHCISHYDDQHVERISEKIFAHNHGQYPIVPLDTGGDSAKIKNVYLQQLAVELFPECDVGLIREKILKCVHSPIYKICEELLKMDEKLPGYPRRLKPGVVEQWEYVKSYEYQKEAMQQLYANFPTVFKSTVNGVLAENNYDYLRSYDKLSELSGTTNWLTPVATFFNTTLRDFLQQPRSQPVHNPRDLDFLHDIDALHRRERDAQSLVDAETARDINTLQYTLENQLITCGCCYGDFVFEDLTTCTDGHVFCHTCVNRLVSEGMFGQGSLRGKPVPCIESDGCDGTFSDDTLHRVLPPDVYRAWTASLVDENIKSAALAVTICPFCSYCEALEDPGRDPLSRLRMGNAFLLATVAVPVLLSWLASLVQLVRNMHLAAAAMLFSQAAAAMALFSWDWRHECQIAYERVMRKRMGRVFRCLSPECGKVSCLLCGKESKALHKCFEKEQDGLRLYVEKAMADAVKRTCPKCNLSFQKSDGCNKMRCRCGYTMCYVCRKDIGEESYGHFCEHFRSVPGPCKECKKCDLYKTDPDDVAIRKAAETARAEYLDVHPEARQMVGSGLTGDQIIGPPSAQQQARKRVQARLEWLLELAIDYLIE